MAQAALPSTLFKKSVTVLKSGTALVNVGTGATLADITVDSDSVGILMAVRKLVDNLGINDVLRENANDALILNDKEQIDEIVDKNNATGHYTAKVTAGYKGAIVKRYVALYNASVDLTADFSNEYTEALEGGATLKEAFETARDIVAPRWKAKLKFIDKTYPKQILSSAKQVGNLEQKLAITKSAHGF